MSQSDGRAPFWKRRLPLVIALLAGTFVWKGAFGLFATSRDVTWRLAVPYADVRRVELQVWRDEALLRREERSFPHGVSQELTQAMVLRGGPHRAIALVWLGDAGEPRVFRRDFDPGASEALVIEPGP